MAPHPLAAPAAAAAATPANGPGTVAPAPDRQALHLQIARLRDSQARQAVRIDWQQGQITALAAALRTADAAHLDQSARVAALTAEVAALRGSTSWRVTAPLRALRQGWWRLRAARDRARHPASKDEVGG